jgi:hypothetical protein
MSAKKKRSSRNVTLPWERRRARVLGMFSARRFRPLLWVGLVVGLGAWALSVADRRARLRTTRAGIAEVQRAVTVFRAEVGRCPRSTVELVHPPKSSARYLSELPNDGWGRELYVRCPGRSDPDSAEVVSAGPSGSFLVDDNIL